MLKNIGAWVNKTEPSVDHTQNLYSIIDCEIWMCLLNGFQFGKSIGLWNVTVCNFPSLKLRQEPLMQIHLNKNRIPERHFLICQNYISLKKSNVSNPNLIRQILYVNSRNLPQNENKQGMHLKKPIKALLNILISIYIYNNTTCRANSYHSIIKKNLYIHFFVLCTEIASSVHLSSKWRFNINNIR